jgi:uncharacterized protein YlzI (FlbEa/FlbD family)
MRSLIELTGLNGEKLWLNPVGISWIKEEDGERMIGMDDGERFSTKETAGEIDRKCMAVLQNQTFQTQPERR